MLENWPGMFSCSCFLRWRSRLVCWPKQRLHRWHLKGFSLLWMLRTWRWRLDEMLKERSQYLHLAEKRNVSAAGTSLSSLLNRNHRSAARTCRAAPPCASASVWWGLPIEGRFSRSTWREGMDRKRSGKLSEEGRRCSGVPERARGLPACVTLLSFAEDGLWEGRWRWAEVEQWMGRVLQWIGRHVEFQSAKALQLFCHVLHGWHLRWRWSYKKEKVNCFWSWQ